MTDIGFVVRCLLTQGAPFVRNNEVAPVSATAREGLTINPRASLDGALCDEDASNVALREEDVFEAAAVTSSSLPVATVAVNKNWARYGNSLRDFKTRLTEFVCSKITAPNCQKLGYIVLCIALRQN